MPKEENTTQISSDSIIVHLQYINRDITEIKKNQVDNAVETQKILKEIKDGTPSRIEFEDLRKDVVLKAEKEHLESLRKIVENKLVTKDDFAPIKKFVYATIGLVLVTVGVALLSAIIK